MFVYFCIWYIFYCIKCSEQVELDQKVILISFDHLTSNFLKIANSNLLNVSAFHFLLNHGSILNDVSLQNITSETHGHDVISSGRYLDEIPENIFNKDFCEKLIFSQVIHNYEYIWMTNQRMSYQSASYFWPQGYVSINGSLPSFSFGLFPNSINVHHGIGRIKTWLLSQSVKFIRIFIPSPSRKHNSNDFYSETIENANNMLGKIIEYISDVPSMHLNLQFVIIGGLNPQHSYDKPIFLKNNSYATYFLNNYVTRSRLLQSWLPPDQKCNITTDQDESGFIACPTNGYLRKLNYSGILPSFFLAAKPNNYFSVRKRIVDENDAERSAFILTSGSAFRKLSASSSTNVRLVDIYPLVCWLLGLHRPWRHDGRLDVWRDYLEKPPTTKELTLFQDFASGRLNPLQATNDTTVIEITVQTIIMAGTVVSIAFILGITLSLIAIRIRRYHPYSSNGLRTARKWQRQRRSARSQPLLVNEDDEEQEEEVEIDLLLLNQYSTIADLKRGQENVKKEDFLNMLHEPLESGGSRTSIPSSNPK